MSEQSGPSQSAGDESQPPQQGTSRRRRGLGRGLEALLSSSGLSAASEPGASESGAPESGASEEELMAYVKSGGIRMLSVTSIVPNPHQPRTQFDDNALDELSASITEHGIIQPLIVTESPDQAATFWLIAGERRWRAAKRANLKEVPVIVREAGSQQLLEWALVENVQRADLSPLEEAAAYQALMDGFDMTQTAVAERVGKSRSAVANSVRLLGLPPSARTALNQERISAGHARALLSLRDTTLIEKTLKTVLDQKLNVRQTEAYVARLLEAPEEQPGSPPQEEPSLQLQAHMRALEERFRSTLGTKVNLDRRRDGSGKLVVHFYNDEDLEHLFQQIVGESDSV